MLLLAFWFEPEVQEIAAGVAIFLFGMLMLEDGFKLFGGGLLERTLEQATKSVPRSLLFGVVSTTVLQSSSLVSVITISFLSAGLISLVGGIGVIFGANIGTTTGAWLVAGLGLKVNIAAYAMPMIALSIVLVFQKSAPLRGFGYVLAGLGFLFLGIHHMKEGFEAFRSQIDLTQFALTGVAGLLVYALIGMVATVIMQSSHATMVLILTALAGGQVTYDNALALAVGANIGTTITAILGSLSANYQGKRLAIAHLLFNSVTAGVALALIAPLRELVDWISAFVGIADTDYALKLAVFHTIFNTMGVALMLPMIRPMVRALEQRIPEPRPEVNQPRFLNDAVDEFPQTLETALRNEIHHLLDIASELILHGLNLHRHEIFAAKAIDQCVRESRTASDLDIADQYERRVKTLYAAIVDFTSRAGSRSYDAQTMERLYALRDVAAGLVQAIKSVKHLRKNVLRYTVRDQGVITDLYDKVRTQIARILVEIEKLGATQTSERSALWLDQERVQIVEDSRATSRQIDKLIRAGDINPVAATSFLNDSGYGFAAMRELIEAAQMFYREQEGAMAEVESLLSLTDEEIDADDYPDRPSPVRNTTVTKQD